MHEYSLRIPQINFAIYFLAHGAAAADDDDEVEYDIVMIMTREQVGILRTGRSDYRRNNSADPAIHASSSSSSSAAAAS